ncbi:MAG: tripartite tricarboxylate transporter substrate binding protein [Hydrogenophaga sp.]|uniref:Bug family tripartite tricarboxylate transporter substrate binding protein n=1 Tax=Hydrogenophaga sp. TaxID=1904254 RepID=UPI0027174C10|nr:tripartite tricarboxylate transporter substrate binding protein [Hydrogenophaga sp.]MDO9146869.1 tripartite tricarboxylate transporter substrate binding protein [Hydrogenophaga sp.]MDO9605878.1 tripartite tricarboxylate transporter substrate binding protein [Hydrogenophaga sp.]MDP2166684.1 tripartite tricarboxylate transporter substrate binding protein [Hydrogenophaga sp.]MDP3475408.1 tripartite tricarboxylate transporter substrate binding protein [Hydrogenophaga sp.]
MPHHHIASRRTLLGAAITAAALALGGQASAQSFPSKNIRIVVPFGAGGAGDLTARIVAAEMSQSLGQSVVIENRPGAGGVVAAETVARADPDGHTLFLLSNGTAVTAGLFKSLPYDTLKDFAPVSTLGTFDLVVLVPADSPFKTLGELVSFAKANPNKLNMGSINIGSTQNLAAELFKSSAEIDVQIVPFNGTPALIGALRGRQVDLGVEILGPALAQIRAGAFRALAVTGQKRATALPEVPTALEQGVKGYVATSWNGLAAPARTPREVVMRLNQSINAALANPEVRKKLADLNIDAGGSTPEQAAALLASDIKRWSSVIERAGIPKQ